MRSAPSFAPADAADDRGPRGVNKSLLDVAGVGPKGVNKSLLDVVGALTNRCWMLLGR